MLGVRIALLAAAAHALDSIIVPPSVGAGHSFQVTTTGSDSDTYRVFLAAALTGVNGPTCYLQNSTTLASAFDLSIPSDVGPSADYYSIAIKDLTTNGPTIYSPRFNLTSATGVYSAYESQLGGAPFWDANDLPCTAYSCARTCATASYPSDLTDTTAYDTMKSCILRCAGVSPAPSQTAPAHLSSSATVTATATAELALITLTGANGGVLTAVQTLAVVDESTITEAVLGGSLTLTLGASAATLSGVTASLATDGVAVDGTTTVPFTTAAASVTGTSSPGPAGTVPSASASSSAAAERREVRIAGLAGMIGVAALIV
nr:hypothetical protein CFP56_36412 [Quercus suber]